MYRKNHEKITIKPHFSSNSTRSHPTRAKIKALKSYVKLDAFRITVKFYHSLKIEQIHAKSNNLNKINFDMKNHKFSKVTIKIKFGRLRVFHFKIFTLHLSTHYKSITHLNQKTQNRINGKTLPFFVAPAPATHSPTSSFIHHLQSLFLK